MFYRNLGKYMKDRLWVKHYHQTVGVSSKLIHCNHTRFQNSYLLHLQKVDLGRWKPSFPSVYPFLFKVLFLPLYLFFKTSQAQIPNYSAIINAIVALIYSLSSRIFENIFLLYNVLHSSFIYLIFPSGNEFWCSKCVFFHTLMHIYMLYRYYKINF